MSTETCDLLVIGGTRRGLSTAIQAQEGGVERVVVVDPRPEVDTPAVPGRHGLETVRGVPVGPVRPAGDGVEVTVGDTTWAARAAVVALPVDGPFPAPDVALGDDLAGRVHTGPVPDDLRDADVLVVGPGEGAAETALDLVDAGVQVVLALGGGDPSELSRLVRRGLLAAEVERRLTVLWRSAPDEIQLVGGHPMVYFDDIRTPDLQFDHVVYRLAGEPRPDDTLVEADMPPGRVWAMLPWASAAAGVETVSAGAAWQTVRAACFPDIPAATPRPRVWRSSDSEAIEELRAEHYNATIVRFDRERSDLWRIRIRPDHGDTSHQAGQYATLGLGYWELRVDSALEPDLDRKWDRMVRRSYSMSSAIFDEQGYLEDPLRSHALEFYIVRVPPSQGSIPALTPRLAMKQEGDRIHLGARIAGHYTLAPVTDPHCSVVMLGTGTGEAPHNNMVAELFRKGHRGPVVVATTVRYSDDLAYLDEHRLLESYYPNYHYLPLVTRDPGVTRKRYVQDVIREGGLEEFGVDLDPASTHVFLCGHPGMIGRPSWTDDVPTFERDGGVCELLYERGFELDRRNTVGNVHFEAYW